MQCSCAPIFCWRSGSELRTILSDLGTIICDEGTTFLQEMLARHLETIEADMLERDAAFAQLQRDRETMEKVSQSEHREGGAKPIRTQERKLRKHGGMCAQSERREVKQESFPVGRRYEGR